MVASAATTSFDAEAWLSKREILTREAERLRGAYSNCLARVDHPSENVKVPIETFPDGAIKSMLTASRVLLFLDLDFIWADHVVIEQLSEKGAKPAHLEAAFGVVDRQTKSGWAEGPARLEYETTTCTGEDVYFSSPEGFVSIYRDTRIVAKDLRLSGPSEKSKGLGAREVSLLGGSATTLVITSRRCDFDREEHVVLFDHDVHVKYGELYTLSADRIFVFLSEQNELIRIVALGSVEVADDRRSGSCARAIFRRDVNEIEMFGDKSGKKAHLQEADGNAVDGSRIKFWLDAEQVEIVDSVLTVKRNKKGGIYE